MSKTSTGYYNTGLTTKEFAQQLRIQEASIRRRYCLFGSYFGVKPTKLANGKLIWPENAFDTISGRCP